MRRSIPPVWSRRDLLAWATLLPASRLFGQSQEPSPHPDAKFSTEVDVVDVLVTVRDKQGKIVRDLAKSDFILEEDDREQPIKYFAQQADLPLIIGLLADTSGSMRRVLGAVHRASDRFLKQVLREDRDKAFLIHFDQEVELLQDLTSSRKELEDALETLEAPDAWPTRGGGRRRVGAGSRAGTALYDALLLASDELMKPQQGRKAFILLSDGVDAGSRTLLSNAIEAAQRADTLVYAIRIYDQDMNPSAPIFLPPIFTPGGGGMPRRGRISSRPDGKKVMERIARETGAGYFEPSRKLTLTEIYDRIEEELRNQYSLGYTPNRSGAGYRKIRVTVKRKGLVVQAREGYYASGS
jgi:VWFA-related protein